MSQGTGVYAPPPHDGDSDVAAYVIGFLLLAAAVLLFVAAGYLYSAGSSVFMLVALILIGIPMLIFACVCCFYVPGRTMHVN